MGTIWPFEGRCLTDQTSSELVMSGTSDEEVDYGWDDVVREQKVAKEVEWSTQEDDSVN
jgi:hypothetical protein